MSESELPVLFLDVDGVLNSFGASPWEHMETFWVHPDFDPDAELDARTGYAISTSKEIGRALRGLPVEIRWLTTWCSKANSHIAPLVGLPDDLPVAYEDDPMNLRHNYNSYWKLDTVADFVEQNPGRKVIWVDDDAITHTALIRLQALDAQILAIRPHWETGITPDDIRLIEEFVNFSGSRGLTFKDGEQS